jgi:hypothetical protein
LKTTVVMSIPPGELAVLLPKRTTTGVMRPVEGGTERDRSQ